MKITTKSGRKTNSVVKNFNSRWLKLSKKFSLFDYVMEIDVPIKQFSFTTKKFSR